MATITFDNWSEGLDLRRGSSVSDPNKMRVLTNAYVTPGKVLRKRPGLELVANLAGTGLEGLFAGNGKLNVFRTGVDTSGFTDPLFEIHRIPEQSTSGEGTIDSINQADVFGGYIYVSATYVSGDTYHHWQDESHVIEYSSDRAYLLGDLLKGFANEDWGLVHRCIVPSATVGITGNTAASNTVLTTASAHGLAVSNIVRIDGCTAVGPTNLVTVAIRSIDIGSHAVIRTVAAHGYSVGNVVKISGVVDGIFEKDINGEHFVTSVINALIFTVPVRCSQVSIPTAGLVGVDNLNQDFTVLSVPTPTTFQIGVQALVGVITDGTVYVPAGTEPRWDPTINTVSTLAGDGLTQFRSESRSITDPDCPHSESFTSAAEKIWAIDGPVIRGSAISNARVWDATLETLPGVILPVDTHATGSSVTRAVSQYNGRLTVFFEDSVQFWDVDPNPALDKFYKAVDGVGTSKHRTPKEFSGDIIFLAESGFRTVTTLKDTNENFAESDVGSAIDSLVVPNDSDNPVSEFYSRRGQYWCSMPESSKAPVWAYTFSRTQKISAWAQYDFPFAVEYMAVLGSDIYIRPLNGYAIYKVNNDDTVFWDSGTNFEMRIEMPYLDFKKPGSTKYISSMDIVLQGTCEVAFRFDPNDPSLITDPITITGDTRPYQSIPLEITTAGIAPVFTSTSNKDVQIESVTFHFEDLGNV